MVDRYTPTVDLRNYHSEFADTMLALTSVGHGRRRAGPAARGNPHGARSGRAECGFSARRRGPRDRRARGRGRCVARRSRRLPRVRSEPQDRCRERDDRGRRAGCSTRLTAFAAGKIAPIDGRGHRRLRVPECVRARCDRRRLAGRRASTASCSTAIPTLPGVQPSCVVSDSGGTYAACDDTGATPCWRMSTDPGNCGEDLEFTIDRGADDPATQTNLVTVQCVTP